MQTRSSPWFGQWSGQTPFVDPAQDNALPEVGQDRILDLLGSLSGRSLAFGASLQPRAEQSLLDLLDSLDPQQDMARARLRSRALLGQGAESGRRSASRLRQMGYGAGVQAGAQLDARNRAARASQDSLMDILSPESRQRRLMAMIQAALSPQSPPTLGSRFSAYGQEGQRRLIDRQTSGGGALDGLFDIFSAVAPYVFRGPGGSR